VTEKIEQELSVPAVRQHAQAGATA
jgi:hypothetical protein